MQLARRIRTRFPLVWSPAKVEVIEIPEELKVVATYPIGVTREARSPDLAQKWVDLVLSDEGQEVMKKYGFEPVGNG